ncbi:ORFV protein [Rhodobacter sp. AKP1]|nr:ORFV protein [Rhodobacter sp. AKP1]
MDGPASRNPLRAMIFSARTSPTCFGPTGCRESRSPPGGSSLPWGRCRPSTLPLGLVSPAAKRLSSRTFSE